MSTRTILHRRLPLLVAASLAGLGLAASPALAGSDGDAPPAIEQPPAAPTPAPLPLPHPAPTSAPTPPAPSSSVKGEQVGKKARSPKAQTHKTTNHTVAFVTKTTSQTTGSTVSTFPTGGVQAGAGGTSLEPGTPAATLGLAGGSLALLLASGGVAAVRRRGASSR